MQPYNLWAQSYYLSKKVTTDYRAEGNIVDEERYAYTDYGVLSSLKSNKHGVEKEKQFKYANSFTDAVSVKMKGKYMVGMPIEHVELSAGKVVNASKTEYKDTLNMILPTYVEIQLYYSQDAGRLCGSLCAGYLVWQVHFERPAAGLYTQQFAGELPMGL